MLGDIKSTVMIYRHKNVMISLNIDMWFPKSNSTNYVSVSWLPSKLRFVAQKRNYTPSGKKKKK